VVLVAGTQEIRKKFGSEFLISKLVSSGLRTNLPQRAQRSQGQTFAFYAFFVAGRMAAKRRKRRKKE
jgi:hypothetical protein